MPGLPGQLMTLPTERRENILWTQLFHRHQNRLAVNPAGDTASKPRCRVSGSLTAEAQCSSVPGSWQRRSSP